VTEPDERCHWNGEERVTRRHLRDCITSGCDGCAPCEKRHCTMPRCSRHTDDLRCAKCVGKVREHLRRIADLCRLAPAAAVEAGNVATAALDLAGPIAERSTYEARWFWAVHRGGLCTCRECPDLEPVPVGPACEKCAHHTCRRIRYEPTCPGLVAWLDNADDERHPLWVLGSWDMLIAEHLGHVRRNRVTIASAAAYLDANLTDLARHADFGFDELAREVAECLTHVEQVLLVAEHVQRGAPCPRCRASGLRAKPMERRYEPGTTDDNDAWTCPTCDHTMTLDEYGRAVYVDYLANADRLTAAQIQAQYRVPASTVRRWANEDPPRVRKRGFNGERQQLYDVADVKAMRDTPEADCA
jgi:hypothetical protein